MLTSFGVVCRCCCCCCLLLLPAVVVVVFHKHCRHVIAASIAVVVVAKWGRVRVDFCTLHFKYEHIFVQCTKRKERNEARNNPQLWLQLQPQQQLRLELQKESQAGAANTGNMLLLSLERPGVKYFYKAEGGGRGRIEERGKERGVRRE